MLYNEFPKAEILLRIFSSKQHWIEEDNFFLLFAISAISPWYPRIAGIISFLAKSIIVNASIWMVLL